MNRRTGGREDGTMGGREEGWEVSLSGSFDPGTSHLKVLVTCSPGHGESSMVPPKPTPLLREEQSPFQLQDGFRKALWSALIYV